MTNRHFFFSLHVDLASWFGEIRQQGYVVHDYNHQARHSHVLDMHNTHCIWRD